MKTLSKAIFLDRDGTISIEIGYIDNADDFALYPDSVRALADLRDLGYKLIIITNQSGVARGYFEESRVHEINNRMIELLAEHHIHLDGIYYCPHLADGKISEYAVECSCRKPKTGMIKQAQIEHAVDLKHSILIGDTITDILCGKNAGLTTILVRTGHGKDNEMALKTMSEHEQPDFIADSIGGAVKIIRKHVTDYVID